MQQVTRYGELAGVAFQLADDVIDVRSDAATTGKTPGTDLREGVPTMPVLLLRRRVATGGSAEDAALLAAIDGDLSPTTPRLPTSSRRLGAHSVVDETAALAARGPLAPSRRSRNLPDGDVKASLVVLRRGPGASAPPAVASARVAYARSPDPDVARMRRRR